VTRNSKLARSFNISVFRDKKIDFIRTTLFKVDIMGLVNSEYVVKRIAQKERPDGSRHLEMIIYEQEDGSVSEFLRNNLNHPVTAKVHTYNNKGRGLELLEYNLLLIGRMHVNTLDWEQTNEITSHTAIFEVIDVEYLESPSYVGTDLI